ncbi:E3 ubiquitin-protein ligase TRIM39 isoform X3 [Lampris incognitus]|nr:E3 ubiquitin-protein ligase TRIM39 isoform X3 [Lampris incognitus]
MASAGSLLSEDQFLCPICLDVFTQPVSTPCGHNFCRDCIKGYWESSELTQCPMCKHTFYQRPELKVNTFISEVAAQFRRSLEMKPENEGASSSTVDQPLSHLGEVPCDVCSGKTVRAFKSCLDCLASYCHTHLEPHQILGTFKKHRLINPVMSMQDRVCKRHERLLESFCNTDQKFVCQVCLKRHHRGHRTVSIETESQVKRTLITRMEAEVQQMIQDRMQKVDEMTHAMLLSRRNTEQEIEESLQIFAAFLRLIQRGQAEVVEAIEGRQQEDERRVKEVIEELEQEITKLRQRSRELEQLSHTEDHLHLLKSFMSYPKPPATKDWSGTSAESILYVGTVRRAVRRTGSHLEEKLKSEVKRLCEMELERARRCTVDVTLDPDTAHPKLVLSKNRKEVHHGDVCLRPSDKPERFYPGISVLGKEGFSTGRFYYEVQVKGKTEWDIGVGRQSVNRKGGNTLSPEGGYWTLGMRSGKEYWALANPPIALPLQEKPQRVGVYVDTEAGQVSFYNVDARSHIYSFTGCSFGERLFPYFNPRRNHGGINSTPLIIPPVCI